MFHNASSKNPFISAAKAVLATLTLVLAMTISFTGTAGKAHAATNTKNHSATANKTSSKSSPKVTKKSAKTAKVALTTKGAKTIKTAKVSKKSTAKKVGIQVKYVMIEKRSKKIVWASGWVAPTTSPKAAPKTGKPTCSPSLFAFGNRQHLTPAGCTHFRSLPEGVLLLEGFCCLKT